jgi:uncharacterized protein YdhG (YjbR/CyaY superfamily)
MARSSRPATRKSPAKTVDEYLARVPKPARGTLKKIRAAIRSTVPPEATEVISYGIPSFKFKGWLVGYAAFANHCSFFPGALPKAFTKQLKNFSISKVTIRFPTNRPLPPSLVKKLVKARMAQNKLKEQKKQN